MTYRKDMPCVITENRDIIWTDPAAFESVVFGIFTYSELMNTDKPPVGAEFRKVYNEIKRVYPSGFRLADERDTASSYRRTTLVDALGMDRTLVDSIALDGHTIHIRFSRPATLEDAEVSSFDSYMLAKPPVQTGPDTVALTFKDSCLNPDISIYYRNFM